MVMVFSWSNMRLDYSRKLFPRTRCFSDTLRDAIFDRIHCRIFCSFDDSNINDIFILTILIFFLEFINQFIVFKLIFWKGLQKKVLKRHLLCLFSRIVTAVYLCTTRIACIGKMRFKVPLKILFHPSHFSLFSIFEFMGFCLFLTYRANNISLDFSSIVDGYGPHHKWWFGELYELSEPSFILSSTIVISTEAGENFSTTCFSISLLT